MKTYFENMMEIPERSHAETLRHEGRREHNFFLSLSAFFVLFAPLRDEFQKKTSVCSVVILFDNYIAGNVQ